MKPQDKVMKAALLSMESVKDTLERNVLAAVQSKLINVDPSELPKLISLLKSSVDEGFQKSYRVLSNTVGTIVADEVASVVPKKAPKFT